MVPSMTPLGLPPGIPGRPGAWKTVVKALVTPNTGAGQVAPGNLRPPPHGGAWSQGCLIMRRVQRARLSLFILLTVTAVITGGGLASPAARADTGEVMSDTSQAPRPASAAATDQFIVGVKGSPAELPRLTP